MATFFDTTLEADLDLLHHTVRMHEERDVIVEQVEYDILQEFTIRTGVNTYRVELEGYDDDTPANSHAQLKDLLRRAIGKVLSHRLRYLDVDPNIEREKLMDYEYDRGTGAGKLDILWPEGWSNEIVGLASERAPLFHV